MLEEMAAKGFDVPALQTRVTVLPHLSFHWGAFNSLNSDRQSGMSLGQIPWTSIDRYAQRYGIDDPDEFDRFSSLIRAMDRTFLAWHAETAKKD